MSKTIDERVVSMKFDNSNFEKNVKTSMSTLDKLKQSLHFKGATKGLEDVNSAANKVNTSGLSGLGSGIEAVRLKFSALQVVGVTALASLTNQALTAGKQIASALTIDPIKTGFQEYETQIGAIQTILANTQSKGSTLDDVNNALDELNKYADQTIYNFTEMTRNIGTFTAAGVDLDKSVTSIKGIANLAAVSGSTSLQASTAMYQLSQALAAGRVSLMDWNSVVNAGMGGELFQNALKRTAENMGTDVDALIKKYGSFRESLTQGEWLTADVLTETLTQLSGAYSEADLIAQGYTEKQAKEIVELANTAVGAATEVKTFTALIDTTKEALQSGWTQTWEILIGDFEEAKDLFSGISNTLSDMINSSAEARNKVLEGWKDMGGRTALIESFKNVFEGLGSIVTPIIEAFREIFPPATSKQLYDFTVALRDLTKNFKLSDEASKNLKNTFKGLFSIASVAINIFTSIARGVLTLVGSLFGASDGILSVTGAIGNFVTRVSDSIKEIDIFGKSVDGIAGFFSNMITAITGLVIPGLEGFTVALNSIWSIVEKVAYKIGDAFTFISDAMANAFKNGDASQFLDIINGGIFASILLGVRKFMNNFLGELEDEGKGVFESIRGVFDNAAEILDTVRESLQIWQTNLRASILLKLAGAIAVLTGAILILSTIDKDALSQSLGALTLMFTELLLSMLSFNKLSGTIMGSFSSIGMMIGLATSILILASALKKISSLDSDQLQTGILGVAGLAAIMVAVSKVLSMGGGTILKGATSVVLFATAIKIMASTCIDLSSLDWESLAKGILGVSGLLTAIGLFISKANFSVKSMATAASIVVLAGAIKILETTFSTFAGMDWEEIVKGLAAIGGLFVELIAITKLIGSSKGIIRASVSIALIGASLTIFSSVLKDLGQLSWDEVARGLVAIAGSLAAVTFAARGLPSDNLLLVSGALPAVTSSLLVLGNAMEKLGSLSWNEVIKGLVGAGGALLILSKSLQSMRNVGAAPATLLAASAALLVMSAALSSIGGLGIVGVAASLAGLAGTFTILGIAVSALKPLIPSIFALSGSITTLGASLIALGAGLAVTGTGMLAMITSLASAFLLLQSIDFISLIKGLGVMAAMFTIIGVAATLLKPLTLTILSLSGSIALLSISCMAMAVGIALITSGLSMLAATGEEGAKAIVGAIREILVGLSAVIVEIIPNLANAFKELLLGFIDIVVSVAPELAKGILSVILEVLKSLSQFGPQIIDVLLTFVIDIINGVASRVPELMAAIVNLLSAIFSGIGDAISMVDIESLKNAVFSVGILALLMKVLATVGSSIPGAMVGVLGIGAILAELSLILAALGALSQIPGLEWLISEGGNFLSIVGTAIGQFIGGIAGGVMSGMSSSFPKIGKDLSDFMTNLKPFLDGAYYINPSMVDSISSIAKTILILTGADIINGIASWLTGGNSMAKFGEQLVPFGESLKSYSDTVQGIDSETIKNSSIAAESLSKLANGLPKVGGLISLFEGENSIANFGDQLVPFGEGMKEYSDSISGIDTKAISASATAAKSLSELANGLPNSGGLVSWFVGDNKISDFGEQLITFGDALSDYSDAINGINPDSVVASAVAAKSLSELANNLPNTGGIMSWFTGDNKLSDFGDQLVPFGKGMKAYSDSIKGIDEGAIIASTIAGRSLSSLADTLPNSGGIISWFTGDNKISDFGDQLVPFGKGMKAYSESISGIDSNAVSASATAALALSELANNLPNTGGLQSLFSGEYDLTGFGNQLEPFGKGIKKYSDSVVGVDASAIEASSVAVSSLSELAKNLPTSGGILSWFTGSQDLTAFSEQLPKLGEGIKKYATEIDGISPETISNSATAVSSLSELAKNLPTSGGILSWFTGSQDLTAFSEQLPKFGEGIKKYATEVSGVKPETITSSASAAMSIAELIKNLPMTGGIVSWFTGGVDVGNFVSQLKPLGEGLRDYSTAVEGIKPEAVTASASGAKALAEAVKALPTTGGLVSWFSGGIDISGFVSVLDELGMGMKDYSDAVSGIKVEAVKNSSTAAKDLASVVKSMNGIDSAGASSFKDAVNALANTNYQGLIDALGGKAEALSKAGVDSISSFISGMKSQANALKTATTDIAKSAVSAIESQKESFSKIGSNLISKFISGVKLKKKDVSSEFEAAVKASITKIKSYNDDFNLAGQNLTVGFADGISSKQWYAEAKAKAMAEAAKTAAERELDEHSPSKEFYRIGAFAGQGFVNALGDYASVAYNVSSDVAKSAKNGLGDSISKISELINSDVDVNPVISPVVDLSNVAEGANAINGMFGLSPSIAGITADAQSLNYRMNRIQNGASNDDVVSAINSLKKSMDDASGDTYNVNGITYDDGSNVSNAVRSLIRAARVERRK